MIVLKRHFGYIFNLILTIMKYIKLYESDNEYIADKDNFSNTTICYINSIDSLICVKENIDGDVVVPDVPKDEPNDPIEPDVPTESESGETTPNYFIGIYKTDYKPNGYGHGDTYLKNIFHSSLTLSQISELYIDDIKQDQIKSSYYLGFDDMRSTCKVKCVMSDTFNNCSHMFYGCSGLTSLDFSHFKTSDVINMSYMFCGCSSLKVLDLSHFNTSNVVNMSYMFQNCCKLTSLDVSSFNTSNVVDMCYMFEQCSSLPSLNVINFNTSNVVNMGSMFRGCFSLTSLNLNTFQTSNVTNMYGMFEYCTGLTSLNINSFNTSNVKDMGYMFDECPNLISLDLTSFDIYNCDYMTNMFLNCINLISIKFGKNANVKDGTTYMFQGLGPVGKVYYPLKYQESWETLLKKSSFPSTWQAIAVDYDNI